METGLTPTLHRQCYCQAVQGTPLFLQSTGKLIKLLMNRSMYSVFVLHSFLLFIIDRRRTCFKLPFIDLHILYLHIQLVEFCFSI